MLNKEEQERMKELYLKAVDEFLESMDFIATDYLEEPEQKEYNELFNKQFEKETK